MPWPATPKVKHSRLVTDSRVSEVSVIPLNQLKHYGSTCTSIWFDSLDQTNDAVSHCSRLFVFWTCDDHHGHATTPMTSLQHKPVAMAKTKRKRPSRWRLKDLAAVGVLIVVVEIFIFHKQIIKLYQTPNIDVWSPLNVYKSSSSSSAKNRVPDGTFNGYPIYYHQVVNESIYSQVHCVGETYPPVPDKSVPRMKRKHKLKKQADADWTWTHRSCQFSFFCFDLETREYQIFQDPREHDMLDFLQQRPHMDVSQSFVTEHELTRNQRPNSSYAVSIGGINLKWGRAEYGMSRLKWFPRILHEPPKDFYALPDNVVLLPFHSLAGFNPGHLVWDDFLPIFTILKMFQLDRQELLLLRYVLPGDKGLWASCDWGPRNEDCINMLRKFTPMMSTNPDMKIITQREVNITSSNATSKAPKSNLVCARKGLAGLGALTDHGSNKGHGWTTDDYKSVHNHGRAALFWDFRLFLMNNLGVVQKPWDHEPFKIIFSAHSSSHPGRSVSFDSEVKYLQDRLDPNSTVVEAHVMSKYSLKEQAEMVSQTAIYVTGAGGGAVTATFLPRGASLLVYYYHEGGSTSNNPTGEPARLDWDMFNNMGYVRVHWLPMESKILDTPALMTLILHELDMIQQESKLQSG